MSNTFYKGNKMNFNYVNVYCCGGTGINLGAKINQPNCNIINIDSSTSNLGSADNAYLIENMDGAGKLRAVTYEAFKTDAENVLHNHKPSQGLNVVISSLSGGTGSVIAPLITRELLERGNTVIVIAVATDHSVKELENSVNTILTYNNFSQKTGKPISMYYCNAKSRLEVDNSILAFMATLSIITDREITREFDTADLHNWVNYNLVTSLPVGISFIQAGLNNEISSMQTTNQNKDIYLASSILISNKEDSYCEGAIPEYLAKVLVVDPSYDQPDYRIDNIVGKLPLILKELRSSLDGYKEAVKVNKVNKIDIVEADDGMVL